MSCAGGGRWSCRLSPGTQLKLVWVLFYLVAAATVILICGALGCALTGLAKGLAGGVARVLARVLRMRGKGGAECDCEQ